MCNSSFLVFISALIVKFEPSESITGENSNRIKSLTSQIYDRKLKGCLEGEWGCLGLPGDCIGNGNCEMLATYHAVEKSGDVTFSLIGQVDIREYLALGLSTDDKMGDDGVVFCYNDQRVPSIGMSWNVNGFNGPDSIIIDDDNVLLKNPHHTYRDHWLFCEFTLMKETRVVIPTFNRRKSTRLEFLHLDQPYYLQLAKGRIHNRKLEYHGFNNKITTHKEIYLNSSIAPNVMDTTSNPIIKAHGSLMVISWMFFADVGTFTAGYVRTKFPEHAGLYWFHIHQVCMSITWCLSMVSVLMMFVKFGATPLSIVKLNQNPHAVFGVIAMVLTFIQPIMGFLRPGPLSIYRRHFNVIHRFTGYITTCFSLMAILSASFLPEAMLKTVSIFVSGSFVVFYILCHFFLRFVKRKGLTEMVSLGYFLCIGGIFSFMIGFMYLIMVS